MRSERLFCEQLDYSPSGLTGRVRGMKVREERVLADRKLAKSGGQIDGLLAAYWEETLDAGPYTLGEGGSSISVSRRHDRLASSGLANRMVGSIKTIEKNGGVLESIVTDPDSDKPKRRYWAATAD